VLQKYRQTGLNLEFLGQSYNKTKINLKLKTRVNPCKNNLKQIFSSKNLKIVTLPVLTVLLIYCFVQILKNFKKHFGHHQFCSFMTVVSCECNNQPSSPLKKLSIFFVLFLCLNFILPFLF